MRFLWAQAQPGGDVADTPGSSLIAISAGAPIAGDLEIGGDEDV